MADFAQELKTYLAGATSVSALVNSGAQSRVYDLVARQRVVLPLLVIDETGGQSSYHLRGETGLAQGSYMIWSYAETSTAAVELWSAVRRSFEATFGDGPAGLGAGTGSITGATQTNPVVITSTAHGLSDGDGVTITGVVGMTELNNRRFVVTSATANTFALEAEDGTGHTAYSSGGTWTSGTVVHSAVLDTGWRDRGFLPRQDGSEREICYCSSRYDIWHTVEN